MQLESFGAFILGFLAAAVAALIIALKLRRGSRGPQAASEGLDDIQDELGELDSLGQRAVHPRELLDSAVFRECVRRWSASRHGEEQLLEQARSGNSYAACIALEALGRRGIGEDAVSRLIAGLGKAQKWPLYFSLRALLSFTSKPLVGAVIAQVQEIWLQDEQAVEYIREFVAARLEGGETPAFGAILNDLPGPRLARMRQLLACLEPARVGGLVEELKLVLGSRLNREFLDAIGRVWSRKDLQDQPFEYREMKAAVDRVRDLVLREPRRSALLVGEPGTGKTTIVRAVAAALSESGWSVFESRASEIIAGQIFIGQPQQRVRDLVQNLAVEKLVIWFIPNFEEMQYLGRSYWDPTSVLDMILPLIEGGRVLVIGELRPSAYGQLVKAHPRVKSAFTAVQVQPPNDADTLALARNRIAAPAGDGGRRPEVEDRTLREALSLARQYLSGKETPGNVLDLLTASCRKAAAGQARSVDMNHVLGALSEITGLPRVILDEQERLSIEELRSHFRTRILGQAEAVDCLVERVAMIKAGLCDASRPSGVFLFVGPTGTGKTEVAKTLATFLFGSPERLIRQDMSEYQTSESVAKILGERGGLHDEGSLVGKIRRQPFAVVLLDEFEKADPRIWDLFLQVFDEGRLTDAQGNTADFRHCIFILTSNLGTTLSAGLSIGFTPASRAFSPQAVHKAVVEGLRPELLNRIDRVVIFRPLERPVMREILRHELELALQRRGLRTRQWAVEWEDSALEFLLAQGFSLELGARPLKRAIDRYLLSPLAITLVNHQAPQGDQFLFVRSDGKRILVEFVDPDHPPETEAAAVPAPAPAEEAATPQEASSLRRLILQPLGSDQEVRLLAQAYERLSGSIRGEAWRRRKEEALARLEDPDFWSDPDRFSTLGAVEYMERIKSGLETARSLLQRLGAPGSRPVHSPHFVSRLSLQLYLLSEACASLEQALPKDAFLKIEVIPDSRKDASLQLEFADRLCRMYLLWAGKRHMRFKSLQDERRNSSRRLLLAVSGFGAYSILAPENGLHVFEIPEKEKAFKRCSVPVMVAAQPEEPALGEGGLLEQAGEAFRQSAQAQRRVVRYYRAAPSALVRDSVSKWRSGRLDMILDGNFDLFARSLGG
jgi:ATP-dependent Clp protease ATP-binding subunit ClpC